MTKTVACAVAVLGGLAALGSKQQQAAEFPKLAAEAREGTGRVEACTPAPGMRARCGVYRVWEDRASKRGRTIDIAFVVLPALDSARATKDALIMLPGGPGQGFTSAAIPVGNQLADLRSTRDILLVDVRGVGRSQSLSCNVPYPSGFRSRFGNLFPLDHIAACRDSLSRRANLSLYTTANSVDDVEELRTWLGYTQLNLVGGSYGTRVAQVYLRRHPKSVRTVVLNGVAPIAELSYVQHARILQRALDRVIKDCLEHAACNQANPGLQDRLSELLQRFRAGPIDVEVQGERVPFGMADLAYALRGLLYGRAGDVPGAVVAAAGGDVKRLADYYVQRTAWVSSPTENAGYHFSVLCAEDIGPLTDADVTRETANTFMGATLINSYRNACKIWPHARLPQSHFTPVKSDVPTLLLSGGRDPVTPPEGGDEVARHLTRSVHVVVPTGGHGVGGPCIRGLINQVITTGSVTGLNSAC